MTVGSVVFWAVIMWLWTHIHLWRFEEDLVEMMRTPPIALVSSSFNPIVIICNHSVWEAFLSFSAITVPMSMEIVSYQLISGSRASALHQMRADSQECGTESWAPLGIRSEVSCWGDFLARPPWPCETWKLRPACESTTHFQLHFKQ